MEDVRKLRFQVALLALVLGAAAFAGWHLLGSGKTGDDAIRQAPREGVEARRDRRDDRRERQAGRLREALEKRQRGDALRRATPDPGAPSAPVADVPPAPLTNAEKAALRGLMERLYSPERLREALAERTAPEVVREMNRVYGEAFGAESLGGPDSSVPVTPALREAVSRMGLLKDYGMNVLHAQRGEGEGETQRRLVEKINGSFAERIEALNADYPFLGARLVEP
jgi:hypothetical protein